MIQEKLPNNYSRYTKAYYESLKPHKIPASWFAGDLMHYIFAEDFVEKKKVLDAGCGTGYGSYHLSIAGADEVVGIDISKENIKKAKNKFTNQNLQFVSMDITRMSFPNKSFDIVVNFEVIEHLPSISIDAFMNEIARVLKDDGKFVISTPNIDVYSLGNKRSETPGHINELSVQEFMELMKRYFEKCEFFYQFRYDKHELDLQKEQQSRQRVENKKMSWRRVIPNPIKKTIKNTLKLAKPSFDNSDLIKQMQIWSVEKSATIADLDLSVIQLAVCEGIRKKSL